MVVDRIYAIESIKARTRLYRMGITKFLSEVTTDFEVLANEMTMGNHSKKMFNTKDFWLDGKKIIIKFDIVKIDKSLNKYDDIVLFPYKLEKANEMLCKVGLPKHRQMRSTIAKSTLAIGWVSFSADSLVVAEKFVLRIKLSS